ncbi:SIR2 family protein [Pectinatus frisingensis]|uniref:SIR2 family protein n=1 Tax=Pectinatus frisingensis TaxID=865 RepID=UPI0018C4941D|nr:SIR2 family protein [Pectinatus frisingensis]
MTDGNNILKIRGDSIIKLTKKDDNKYAIVAGKVPSWLNATQQSSMLGLPELRTGIEPWLTSLFQSEHLSVLTGNGLSIAVQFLATGDGNTAMSGQDIDSAFKDKILEAARKSSVASGRGEKNIEDEIRVTNELIRGLEILGYDTDAAKKDDYKKLCQGLEALIKDFTDGISKIEASVATAALKERAFGYLVSFLMSFASRTGTRERLNIFTTNYDRLIEAGAELAGLHLLDRFVGTLAPIFRSSRLDIDMHYNPPGIRGEPRYLEGVARFTKLHGSIDWVDVGTDIRRIGLPFGSADIKNFLNAPGLDNVDRRKVMIYPNSSKDRETAEYPYVELFRDFAAALCRPNSTLVTYGYGFGDDHINRIIRDMLTIPSTHLIVISYDDAGGRIKKKYEEFGRSSQISLVIGKDLANLPTLVDYFMPKPSIDKASIRMGELLKQRYSETKVESVQADFPSLSGGADL